MHSLKWIIRIRKVIFTIKAFVAYAQTYTKGKPLF